MKAAILNFMMIRDLTRDLIPAFICAVLATVALLAPASLADSTPDDDIWAGTWFTCEFAQRQRAPDDRCAMFDDEGFRFSDGRFTYVRITESNETACRGAKVGQCFRSDRPSRLIR